MRLRILEDWVPTCTARQLFEQIYQTFVKIDLTLAVQAAIAFEFEHNYPQFEETAKDFTNDYAYDASLVYTQEEEARFAKIVIQKSASVEEVKDEQQEREFATEVSNMPESVVREEIEQT